MDYNNIQKIESISTIYSELENAVKGIVMVEIGNQEKKGKASLEDYEKILGYKVRYHKLLARGYEIANDEDCSWLGKYDELVNDYTKKFRLLDEPIEKGFKKVKRHIKKIIKEKREEKESKLPKSL